MPHGKKKAFRPNTGPKASIAAGNKSDANMNEATRYLLNGPVLPQASLEGFSDSCDPRYADMPPLEDINDSGSETMLLDKYNCLPKVMVSHFPYGVSEAQLLGIFDEFNPLMCRILINAPTPVVINATSACIYFKDERDAVAALKLHRTLFKNYVIEVKEVKSSLF